MENNTTLVPPGFNSVPEPKKIGRIKGGYMIAIESFRILNKNKSIMLFPLFSLIAELIAVGFFIICIYFFALRFSDQIDKNYLEIIEYGLIFIFYIASFFIASYFQAGLVSIVSAQINGKKMSFSEGMNIAAAHTGKIFMWSFIAATVGVILELIANKFKFIGKLVTSIIGFTWNIITFFIVPVLILEEKTVGESVKRSGSVFKNKWGETLIANLSTGLLFAFLTVLGLAVFFVIAFLGQPRTEILILLAVLLALYLVTLIVLSLTIEGIYRTVLYEYAAHDKLPESFNRELISNAIKTEK